MLTSVITVKGISTSNYGLETNVGDLYISHEVQVGLSGYFVVKYYGKAGLNGDAYTILKYIPNN